MRKNRIVRACVVYLAALWIVSCLPFVAVLLEFRDQQLCSDGRMLGWFIATLYGSFFIFPLFIGGLLAAALTLPLATTVSLTVGKRSGWILLAFLVITTILISSFEFIFSSGGLFQVRPQQIARLFCPVLAGRFAATNR